MPPVEPPRSVIKDFYTKYKLHVALGVIAVAILGIGATVWLVHRTPGDRQIDDYFWTKGTNVLYVARPAGKNSSEFSETVVPLADPKTFTLLSSATDSQVTGEYGAKSSSRMQQRYYGDADGVYLYCDELDADGESNRLYFIVGADPKTFTQINFYYAKDRSHVWYVQCNTYEHQLSLIKLIPEADPQTFTSTNIDPFKDLVAHDKNRDYYWPDVGTADANFPWYVNRFAAAPTDGALYFYINTVDRTDYIKSGKLYGGPVDQQTFDHVYTDGGDNAEVIFYKDKKQVYQVAVCGSETNNTETFKLLSGIDPDTFKSIGGQIGMQYAKDKDAVYVGKWQDNCTYSLSKVPSADPDTFTVGTVDTLDLSNPATLSEVVTVFNTNAQKWNIKELSNTDHVYGDLTNVRYIILTYGDMQSSYTLELLHSMFDMVNARQDVVWVYRHFPLEQIHTQAFNTAVASECVSKLASNEAFWTFIQGAMETKTFDAATNTKAANELGISQDAFTSCLASTTVKARVRDQIAEAKSLGATGAPYSQVLSSSGQTFEMAGAFKVESIDNLLNAL